MDTNYQGVPPEIGSFTAEVVFVFVCSAGLLMFAFLGDITVNQEELKRALDITNGELPWLLGAYTLHLSRAVVISGSVSDLRRRSMFFERLAFFGFPDLI
jgi:hypothetical protein